MIHSYLLSKKYYATKFFLFVLFYIYYLSLSFVEQDLLIVSLCLFISRRLIAQSWNSTARP